MTAPSPTDTAADAQNAKAAFWSDASLFGVVLIWGVNMPVMKIGLDQLNVFVFNAIRLCVSAGVLALFAWRELRRGVFPRPEITWKQIALYGVLASGLYQLLFLLGIAHTTAGNTALIMATVPMWTALLARTFLGEILHRISWGGLVIALTGTILVAVQKGDLTADENHLLGNLIVLGAALTWSSVTTYSRRLLTRISPMQLSAMAVAIALPLHLTAAWWNYEESLAVLRSPGIWVILLYSGILSSGLALPMWSFGVRHAGAAHAAVFQNLIPVVAIIAAWFSRGETASVPQLIGGALILGGLVIMRIGRRKLQNQ